MLNSKDISTHSSLSTAYNLLLLALQAIDKDLYTPADLTATMGLYNCMYTSIA